MSIGLQISRVHMVQSGSSSFSDCAYVKFSTMNEVEDAIKRTDKNTDIKVYRSSEVQMRTRIRQGGLKREMREPSPIHNTPPPMVRDSKCSKSQNDSRSLSGGPKYVRVRGIPWEANADFVFDLFPGLEIDRQNGIQIQYDKGRNTGTAYVEIKNAADYDFAMRADLSETSRYLKVTKASKVEFMLTKDNNLRSL